MDVFRWEAAAGFTILVASIFLFTQLGPIKIEDLSWNMFLVEEETWAFGGNLHRHGGNLQTPFCKAKVNKNNDYKQNQQCGKKVLRGQIQSKCPKT